MRASSFLHRSFNDLAYCGCMADIRPRLALGALAAPFLLGTGTPAPDLCIELANLRNAKGTLLIRLSASEKHFPDCTADPAARTMRVLAGKATGLLFSGVAPGTYAVSVMHDENNNAKLDTTMKIPREGFGFSRNPVVRFGPPKFAQVRFAMGAGAMTLPIRMKYFL